MSYLTGNIMYGPGGEKWKTEQLDEHQARVHGKNSHAKQAPSPTEDQFRRMTDDQVVDAILAHGYAARLDMQEVKNINPKSRARTEAQMKSYVHKTSKVLGELPM